MITADQFRQMQARVESRKPDGQVRREILTGVERELTLHYEIQAECDRRGWLVVHARMDEPTTVARGVPDFIIFKDDGEVLLIEAKTKAGKLTSDQLAWHAWAKKMGHTVHVVRDLYEFLEVAR